MKRIILFTAMLITAVFGIVRAQADRPELASAEIYVVDSELMRLIPVTEQLIKGDGEFMAQQAVRRLIRGYDSNRKIRRLIPERGDCISLKLNDRIACINLKTKYLKDELTSRDLEKLFVYQVVNTVTAVPGIDAVKFTLDGCQTKKLAGYLDMRDVFVPDYLI
ncbi:MAG: GerMN domain-containing protein [bacterium]|nr:GerMN domain-containing protein [bacterium]